jgi:PEP-CTERM motif-containing protein
MEKSDPSGRVQVAALLLGWLALTSVAEAAPISYHTRGEIWPWTYSHGAVPGTTGSNVITFQGINSGTMSSPGVFPLGEFLVAPLPEGTSTTYRDAAFTIALDTDLGGKAATPHPNDRPFSRLSLNGVLNGTVTGGAQSNVTARVLSIEPDTLVSIPEQPIHPILDLPFPLSALTVDQPLMLASSSSGGSTTLWARIEAVPEPATWIVLVLALAGASYWQRQRRVIGPR